jgi:hypothetical protein
MIRAVRHIVSVAVGVTFIAYLFCYLGTTKVRPQGTGGLTGPLKVRAFKNERHLIAFYPLYLVERWARNRSFRYATLYFNVDFEDGHYERLWLYGDGKYGRIWYDIW